MQEEDSIAGDTVVMERPLPRDPADHGPAVEDEPTVIQPTGVRPAPLA